MAVPEAYLRGAIETASPAQLVQALYDGALVAVGRARDALATGGRQGIEPAHRELIRAQDIVLELRACLDRERGGTIAASLDALYGFCIARLIEANVTKDPSGLEPVEEILRVLRDTWAEACCSPQVAARAVEGGGPPGTA